MNKNLLLTSAVLAGSLAWASSASAGLLAEFSIDGGTTFTTICSAASGSACAGPAALATGNGLVLKIASASSNSPGTPTLADLLSATVEIDNNNAAGAPDASVLLRIGDIDYSAPTTPPGLLFESAIGTTVVKGDLSNTLSFFSCIDQANGQNVCPGTFSTPTLNPPITTIGSSSAHNSMNIASLSSPYSMTEELTISLSSGAKVNYSASTRLEPVPEPASLALLGIGLIGLGWRRLARRKTA